MKFKILVTVLLLTACSTFQAPSHEEKAPFILHIEEKPMKAYLAMNLPFAPYKELYEQVQRVEGVALKTRGEAHITVVSPVEYDQVLKKHLSISEIHSLAETAHIQDSPYRPVCIGQGQKKLQGQLEKTYFVVTESPALLELRRQVQKRYVEKGGSEKDFRPENFYPHITLGYTARDLHFEDGVIKDQKSCLYPLE